MSDKLVLIDGNAIMHRAFHAMPALTTPKGDPIGAVYGFMNILVRIIEDLEPTYLAVCFDRKEKTFRHKKYKEYQSHRPPTDNDLSSQFVKIRKLLDSTKVVTFDKAGYEADDLIGTLSLLAVSDKSNSADEVVIVTGDKDQMQLVNKKVKLCIPTRGLSSSEIVGENEVLARLGVAPKQVVDLKALMGDPSDNYPGIRGIGPKTAVSLLEKYKTYKQIYKHIDEIPESVKKKLIDEKRSGDISYELAQIVTDVDMDFDLKNLGNWDLVNEEALETYQEFGMRSLPKRLLSISSVAEYKKNLMKADIVSIAKLLIELLPKGTWAIRGTASLSLQGIDMVVDDIDVVCDKDTALAANESLQKYLVRKVNFSEDKRYKSYFGELNINDTKVEIYGDWQIALTKNEKLKAKNWSKKFDVSVGQATTVETAGMSIPVTSVETELEMFAAMERWNAFHKIKKALEEKSQQRLF